tara:strand:- start:474 stop:794 length:321 start_codon:yes stop_codon:yes gene_type:complete
MDKLQKQLWFDTFWKEYPKKVGKKQCKTYWSKLKMSAELFTIIMDSLVSQNVLRAKYAQNNTWYPNPPDPIRWLKYERWEDELPPIDIKEVKQVYTKPKYKDYDER